MIAQLASSLEHEPKRACRSAGFACGAASGPAGKGQDRTVRGRREPPELRRHGFGSWRCLDGKERGSNSCPPRPASPGPEKRRLLLRLAAAVGFVLARVTDATALGRGRR